MRERLQAITRSARLLSFLRRHQVPSFVLGVGGVNVNKNMESDFLRKYSLSRVGNAVWNNLGFEDKFHVETNILEWLKVHFLYGQFPPSPSRPPYP